jgi:hypothetical protein
MGTESKVIKGAAQGVFYLAILALIVSRSVSNTFSHDENLFIAPGQLLAQQGLLPYVDYPYLHMPYSIPFYALTAWASDFDFLAGRLMSSVAWLGCILLIVAVVRSMRHGSKEAPVDAPSWRQLGWEFLLVYVFVNHGPVLFVLRTALNHSLSTLFGLLAVWFLLRGVRQPETSNRAAFWSGVSIAAAGLVRFNFASLALVLLVCWLMFGIWLRQARPGRLLMSYAVGGVVASAPALAFVALAPREFYYGNLVYIRLNTIYYQQLLHRSGMTLSLKLKDFVVNILAQPLDMLLYAVLLISLVMAIAGLIRRRSSVEVVRLGVAGIALGLWLSALAPTPGLIHYFAAPIPFLIVLLGSIELTRWRHEAAARAAGILIVIIATITTDGLRDPVKALASLRDPSQWPPVQMHEVAMELRGYVDSGRVLTLQPMLPLEAGLEVYPFTANGPFSWRTSLLLTPQRRLEYDVTSPQELPALLREMPPDAIIVGLEAPNAGFERQDLGGLERPFSEYALENGYESITLVPPYWPRGLTVYLRP